MTISTVGAQTPCNISSLARFREPLYLTTDLQQFKSTDSLHKMADS